MSKKIGLLVIISLFIGTLIFTGILLNNKSDNSEKIISSEGNKVINITNKNFENEVLKSDKIVFVDFYADWCSPCKQLSPIIEEVASEKTDVKFVKIDVDIESDLAQKYNVISIPTLVVIKNGIEVDRSIGVVNKNRILELINK